MKLPKHRLDQLDYYEVKPGVEIGRKVVEDIGIGRHTVPRIVDRVTLYWKRKRFLFIPYYPRPRIIEFERWSTKDNTNDTTYYYPINREADELIKQLGDWACNGQGSGTNAGNSTA